MTTSEETYTRMQEALEIIASRPLIPSKMREADTDISNFCISLARKALLLPRDAKNDVRAEPSPAGGV